MIYNSFLFIISFPVIFFVLYAIEQLVVKAKQPNITGNKHWNQLANYFLLFVSYILYYHYNHTLVVILILVSLISYGFAYLLERATKQRRVIVAVGTLCTTTPLLFFKYTDFILSIIFTKEPVQASLSPFVPIGISFFTFQALSYLFDIYRRKYQAEQSLPNYMLYIAFFPSIVAGPINRYNDLMPQIKSCRTFNYDMAAKGIKMVVWGMFLKIVVADRIALYIDPVFDEYASYSGSALLMASFLYSIQLYTDFAGYSLQAIGAASMLGFNLKINFHNPYFATSVTDFWHRWHISLSQWLKDYIYIPLGGSHCSKARNYLNIILTFLVSGIWHGANWTFIMWGGMHGIFQVMEKALGFNRPIYQKTLKVIRIIITFCTINVLWIFFRMPSIKDACHAICKIATNQDLHFWIFEKYILVFILMVFIKDLIDEVRPTLNPFLHPKAWIRWTTYVIVLTSIFLFGVFDAGQFVYARF